MWHITFETRLPVGLGARQLQWDNPRLPTSADFLNLVSLHSDSYWLTLKVDGEESAPLDFVPLIILLDKHQDVLSTCTVKVGHRNPFITASEMLENEQKTAAFTATLRSKSDVANKVAGTSSSEVQAGVDESNKAKDLKNKEVAKVDEAEVTASGSGIKPDTATPASPKPSTPTPVTYGKYTFGGRSALSSSAAPTSAHKMSSLANQKLFSDSGSDSGSDEGADTADSWVDARATFGSQGKAGLQSASDSDSDSDNDDSADANAERDDVDVNELVARVKSMMSSSNDGILGQRETIPLADKGKQLQDLITCRLPLLPRPDAAAAAASPLEAAESGATIHADGGKGKIQDKGKGKATAKAKSRPSYGLSLEDRCISTDNTRESTPVLADSIALMPVSAATLSPSTRSRVASTYFADLCAHSENTAATNGVLDIIQTEGVDLDSALGLKLLQLAKDLQEGGKYCPVAASPYRPIAQRAHQGASSAAKARSAYQNNNHNNNNNSSGSSNGNNDKGHSHSWSSVMHHHEQSARMLEKVLNKLNDHSEMLNAIAEASGVNLLDSDSEADADADGDDAEDEVEPAAQTPTRPQSGIDVCTPKPVTATRQPVDGSPQAALQGLLTAAQTLPGASGVEPVLAPIDTALGEITPAAQPPIPGPFMAICPPHPSAMMRPEDLMRPLPDTSPTSASAPAPAATAMAGAPLATLGTDKPADVNAAIWERVQQFAQSSAAARAKAENEQHEALQAHILDMYRLSTTIAGASATSAASEQAVQNTAHAPSVTAQSVASPTTPSSGSTSTAEIRRSPLEARGLPSNLPDDHPATQRDFDYEHYQHWAAHHARATVAAYPVAVDQRNLHYQQLQQQQQQQQQHRAGVYGLPSALRANAAAAQQAAAETHRSFYMGAARSG